MHAHCWLLILRYEVLHRGVYWRCLERFEECRQAWSLYHGRLGHFVWLQRAPKA